MPLRHNDEEDCNGYYHAGSITGEVVGQENNDIVMLGAGARAPPPAPPAPPAAGAAAATGPLPVMLPQARLPQPTVFDGTTPPFQEWIQETRNFLSINNCEFIRQMDYSLQSEGEVTLQDVTIENDEMHSTSMRVHKTRSTESTTYH